MEINKDEMLELLNKSKSMREVIISLGLSSNGSGGYRYVKDKIIKFGLEIPKYNYYGDGVSRQKYSDENVFCENSTFPRQKIKNRIIILLFILLIQFYCNEFALRKSNTIDQ